MAGEGKVHQTNDDLAAIKTTHQDIIAMQEQTIGRMDSIQSTLDALILKVDNHFEEMKAYFGRMKEARDKGILGVHLPASMVPGIKLDLEPMETNTEADLKHKETTHIKKEKASNSDSATQRTDQVSYLRCHFPELKSQLALVRYPELPRSPGIHRHNDVVEETQEEDEEEEEEEEEEVPLGSHPVAALSDLSSTGSSITNFGGPPSPVGPLPSPPQPMTSESIPTPPPSPNNAPAGPELFILGSILSIPPDDVPPGDSPRMDTNDENDPQNPQPQKENSVCCGFTFLRRGLISLGI